MMDVTSWSIPLECLFVAVSCVQFLLSTSLPSFTAMHRCSPESGAQLIGLYCRIPSHDERAGRTIRSVSEERGERDDQDAVKSLVGRSRVPPWGKYLAGRVGRWSVAGADDVQRAPNEGWIRRESVPRAVGKRREEA